MKKFMVFILTISLLLAGNIVFAEGATNPETKNQPANHAAIDLKTRIAEIKPLLETIRSNRTQILKLTAQAKNAYNKAKTKVKELKDNKDNLTPEQIQSIKDSLNNLKLYKEELKDTLGGIAKKVPNLRIAKKGKDLDSVKQYLNDIINVQNTRIEELKKIIENLNKFASI